MALERSVYDILTTAYVERPDVVHIIDGSQIPRFAVALLSEMRRETNRDFIISVHLTEEPYAREYTEKIASIVDVVFCNDANSVRIFDPDDTRHVYYTPHAYYDSVHYVDNSRRRTGVDVFMCGTYYQERVEFFENVDWTGINAYLAGWVVPGVEPSDNFMNVFHIGAMKNEDVAEWYRSCKIAVNVNRVMKIGREYSVIDDGEAYSVGPRVIEAAACGAFQLSDSRGEMVDVFGDSIPAFSSPKEFGDMVRYYLAHDEVMEDLSNKALVAVAPYSSRNRSLQMMSVFKKAIVSFKKMKNKGVSDG